MSSGHAAVPHPSPRFRTLPEWLAWQESLHVREIDLGLERCRAVAERMKVLAPRYTTISVAGTNGKGSCVAMLDAMLSAANYRVGRYTSPHLIRYSERIRVAGEIAGDEVICEAFDRVDRARGEVSLTYFEFGTLAALDIFKRSAIDVAVLEVGMGGRLDAVNLIDADVALLATIDIDHVDWLGPDRESIGREKAGIFRHSRPAICSDPQPPRSVLQTAEQLGTPLAVLGREFDYEVGRDGWRWWGRSHRYDGLPPPHLHGAFQFQNAAGVLAVLEQLAHRCPVPRGAIECGLRSVELAGRFQVVPGPVTWILDVAHNPQSARVLAESLRALPPIAGRTHFFVGMLKDKDIGGVFAVLQGIADIWHLVTLSARRGASARQLHGHLQAQHVRQPVRLYEEIAHAYGDVKASAGAGDRVVVFGSFLTVAGVAAILAEGSPAA